MENREKLIEENLGLVHACANKFRGRGTEYDDLFQAGCVGLIKAADGFDPSRGFAFSTYAVPVILGEIKRIFRDGGAVKVSRSIKEKGRVLLHEKEKMASETGTEPTISALAEKLGWEVEETAQVINAALPPVSLTQDDESGGGQIDVPVDNENEMFEMLDLSRVIESLNERDREIIEWRYFRCATQSVTAKQLGMSQVQVSRREKKILTLLRTKLAV